MVTEQLRAMTTLIGRAWVPIVMAIVLAVRAFTVFRFQGSSGHTGPFRLRAPLIIDRYRNRLQPQRHRLRRVNGRPHPIGGERPRTRPDGVRPHAQDSERLAIRCENLKPNARCR